ncbi:MAG: carboxylate-amine ligase [Devosia sp.]
MPLPKRVITLGVEEEYLLVDAETRGLASEPPAEFMERGQKALGERVSPEYLQCQIEIATGVCNTVDDVAAELVELRGTIDHIARDYDMRLMAASTHPWGHWHNEKPTEKDRYRYLSREHLLIARRLVVCGMHVHAGIEDPDLRIDLMNQCTYFLPHFLALSTSSPFWQGDMTGLKAMRPTIFGDLPRSGLPEWIESDAEWRHLLRMLDQGFGISDPSMIWWDIRPSAAHPTVEMRVCEMCTRLDDALAMAAIYQSLVAYLCRLRAGNQSWRRYRRVLVNENKWRAQRDGIHAELADLGRETTMPFRDLMMEFVDLVSDDAADLGCLEHVQHARTILERGTSADNQLKVFGEAKSIGDDDRTAHTKVVDWLVDHTIADFDTIAPTEAARAASSSG